MTGQTANIGTDGALNAATKMKAAGEPSKCTYVTSTNSPSRQFKPGETSTPTKKSDKQTNGVRFEIDK